jgi:predicted esterase
MEPKHTYFLIGDDGKAIKLDKIPEGAVRVHLYNFQNVLRPRGPLQKESLSESIYEKLQTYFESWTDEKYGDSRHPMVVVDQLRQNLLEETTNAFDRFLEGLINQNKIQLEETTNEIDRSDEKTKSN